MVDRQFLVARAVAETHRRLAPPSLARIPDTRSVRRRPRLGLNHPRIDGNYRSTIQEGETGVSLARIFRVSGPARGVAHQAEAFAHRPEPPLAARGRDHEWRRLRHRLVRGGRDAR